MNRYKKSRLRYKNFLLHKKLKKENKVFDFNAIDFRKKNVLIIDSIIPEYNKDSGSRRLYNIIKILLEKGYGVFLMADKLEYKYKTEYVSFYEKLGVVVYEPSIDLNGNFITKDDFLKTIIKKMDYSWLHRPDVFYKYSDLIREESNSRLIYDMVDFHYLRLSREWEQSNDKNLKKEVDKYLRIETECCEKADRIITISNSDKDELLKHYFDESKMITISNFHQHKNRKVNNLNKRKDLLFVGGFSHAPNIDSVKYLHDHIMPLVWKKDKNIKVMVVGSYPTEEVQKLNSKRFTIVGFAEDLEPYYNACRVFVAPLRYGAGVKGKIGQSLEYGFPLVTTNVGAEGFDFGDFKDVMISDDEKQFAENVLRLYQDDNLWEEVSKASQTILEPFSLEETEKNILKVLS